MVSLLAGSVLAVSSVFSLSFAVLSSILLGFSCCGLVGFFLGLLVCCISSRGLCPCGLLFLSLSAFAVFLVFSLCSSSLPLSLRSPSLFLSAFAVFSRLFAVFFFSASSLFIPLLLSLVLPQYFPAVLSFCLLFCLLFSLSFCLSFCLIFGFILLLFFLFCVLFSLLFYSCFISCALFYSYFRSVVLSYLLSYLLFCLLFYLFSLLFSPLPLRRSTLSFLFSSCGPCFVSIHVDAGRP